MEAFNLHRACEKGWIDRVKRLLDKGEDVNKRDNYKRTPLHCALRIESSFYEVAFSKFDDSQNPTDYLVTKEKITRLLLSKGASANIIGHSSSMTPLHLAASTGNESAVILLLEYKACPKYRCCNGKTALHYSARGGHGAITKRLIEAGCYANIIDVKGRTPLHDAAAVGHTNIANLLINAGANVNWLDAKNKTPLHYSIQENNFGVSEILLKSGADPHSRDKQGQTPLHIAVLAMNSYIIQLILNHNVQVNSQNDCGETALHLAVSSNNDSSSIVKLLLENYADPNLPNKSGETPLHVALSKPTLFSDIVSILLDYDSDLTIVNVKGKTPFDLVTDRAYYPKTRKIVMAHAVRLRAASQILFNPTIDFLLTNNDPDYYIKCLNEINVMKKSQICQVSLYHILTEPFDGIITLIKNEAIEYELCGYSFSYAFPIYAKMLKMRIERATERKILLVMSENFFFSLPDTLPKLPPECFPSVLKYLSNWDLKTLIECCQ